MASDDGFLSRWARRKQLAKDGPPPEAPFPQGGRGQGRAGNLEPRAASPPSGLGLQAGPRTAGEGGSAEATLTPTLAREREREKPDAVPPTEDVAVAPTKVQTPAEPPLTLADVERLGRDSDYSRFVARDTDPTVQRAAMKKLFSDPHFNVMDGLDTYIGD